MDAEVTAGLMPIAGKAVKLHHLVKAPENAIESIRIRESWNADEPATVYTTPEMLPDGTPCTAATVILRTRGCEWWWKSGCTFCGYFNDVREDVTSLNLRAQWAYAKQELNDFEDCDMIKVYTSGTFFEDQENPPDWQEFVLKETAAMGKHLIIEAQAHLCDDEKIAWVAERHPGCTVAIGLEAFDDEVLKFHCNKGFRIKGWLKAVATLQKHGLRVKTYLLFKPPFMSEGDALVHTSKWIREVAELSDEISVNPMNIQRRTIVDRIFRHREYRPPWLWSLVQMIRDVHGDIRPEDGDAVTRLIVHPTAAGSIRGAHNCGSCDKEVAAAIERYSVSGSLLEFEGITCDCEAIWSAEIGLDTSLPMPLGSGLDRRISAVEALMSP